MPSFGQRFAIEWPSFGQFAMGTAAFPIGFPPRRLSRPLEHYRYRVVAVPGNAYPAAMAWLPLVPDWAAIQDWGGGRAAGRLPVPGGRRRRH